MIASGEANIIYVIILNVQAFLMVPNGFERARFWKEYTEKARQKAKL